MGRVSDLRNEADCESSEDMEEISIFLDELEYNGVWGVGMGGLQISILGFYIGCVI